MESSEEWRRIEYHPEIYEMEIKLPTLKRMAQAKSNPARLLVWTMLLLFAYLAYLVVGEARKLGVYDTPKPPPAASPPDQ